MANTGDAMNEVTKAILLRLGYGVFEVLGRGSFGTVYSAVHKNGTPLAIKVVKLREVSGAVRQKHLANECQVSKQVNHPNLLRTYDVRKIGTRLCFFMEKAFGGDLASYYEKHSHTNQVQSLKWFVQVSHGVAYLHQAKLFHRDIKGQNVLLDHEYNAKLADFGLAGPVVGMSSTFCGTRGFLSPQLHNQLPYSPTSADIFALGVVGFWMFTGRYPFSQEDMADYNTAWRHCFDNCQMHGTLKQLFQDMLSPSEKSRPSIKTVISIASTVRLG